MEPVQHLAMEVHESRVLARGGGVPGGLQVELVQRPNGSVFVSFALDGEAAGAHEWEAGDVEHGVRTFLSLVRRRSSN